MLGKQRNSEQQASKGRHDTPKSKSLVTGIGLFQTDSTGEDDAPAPSRARANTLEDLALDTNGTGTTTAAYADLDSPRKSILKESLAGTVSTRSTLGEPSVANDTPRRSLETRQIPGVRHSVTFQEPVPPVVPPSKKGFTQVDVRGFGSSPLSAVIYLPDSHELPEWYVELNKDQIQVFREVLNLLDGPFNSETSRDKLFQLMKEVNKELTKEQIDQVIDDLLPSSSSEVDFDEFLLALADIDEESRITGEHQRKPEAVTDGSKKSERKRSSDAQKIYYSSIAYFSVAGAAKGQKKGGPTNQDQSQLQMSSAINRVAGSKTQLQSLMRQMLRDARGQFSPYLHPVPFVRLGKRRPPHQVPPKKLNALDIEIEQQEDRDSIDLAEDLSPLALVAQQKFTRFSTEADDGQEIFLDEEDIGGVMKVYASHGSAVAQLPGSHLVPGIKEMLARISVYEPLCSSDRKRRHTMYQLRQRLRRLQLSDPGAKRERRGKNPIKLFAPSGRQFRVDPPKLSPTFCEKHNPTPVNIANMNKRFAKKIADYRLQIRKGHVRQAWNLLERLNIDSLPISFSERFLQTYRAYAPMRLRDIHIIGAQYIYGFGRS